MLTTCSDRPTYHPCEFMSHPHIASTATDSNEREDKPVIIGVAADSGCGKCEASTLLKHADLELVGAMGSESCKT